MLNKASNIIHVAIGVIKVDEERVLITKRHDHLHQGGLWEFPGGKVMAGESLAQALARELHEELGIIVLTSEPLIKIPFDYGDQHVLLDVHTVTRYEGTPASKEGQDLMIIPVDNLFDYDFPAANKGIISAIRLPSYYMITAQHDELESLLADVRKAVQRGVRLIQFRAHDLTAEEYQRWAIALTEYCHSKDVIVILNTDIDNYPSCPADGLHLTRHRLMTCQQRPIAESAWLGASVHNEAELQQAMTIDADYILISPVKKTASHPDVEPIGWQKFKALTLSATMPVYALGGLNIEDLHNAIEAGGQGIAGIRLFI